MKTVLLSGGVDSTTSLGVALSKDPDVVPVFISYGQKHLKKELQAANDVCDHYGIDLKIVDLTNIFQYGKSSLTDHNLEISSGSYQDQLDSGEINTEVEFRNGVFLSVLASISIQLGADEMYYGAHRDELGSIYPDCSREFLESISNTISIGTSENIKVVAPFIDMTKTEIVKLGLSLDVPYELTYSCYEGTDIPCGVCGTCIDRQTAFKNNGIDIL